MIGLYLINIIIKAKFLLQLFRFQILCNIFGIQIPGKTGSLQQKFQLTFLKIG